eukprot:g6517.t1
MPLTKLFVSPPSINKSIDLADQHQKENTPRRTSVSTSQTSTDANLKDSQGKLPVPRRASFTFSSLSYPRRRRQSAPAMLEALEAKTGMRLGDPSTGNTPVRKRRATLALPPGHCGPLAVSRQSDFSPHQVAHRAVALASELDSHMHNLGYRTPRGSKFS